jgi:hypothetical protein
MAGQRDHHTWSELCRAYKNTAPLCRLCHDQTNLYERERFADRWSARRPSATGRVAIVGVPVRELRQQGWYMLAGGIGSSVVDVSVADTGDLRWHRRLTMAPSSGHGVGETTADTQGTSSSFGKFWASWMSNGKKRLKKRFKSHNQVMLSLLTLHGMDFKRRI